MISPSKNHLTSLILFQTRMTIFLQWNINDARFDETDAVHVPDRLLCSASWTCGASCCRRWGAGTWRRMTCAATRGYSWSTGRKRHVHFTQNAQSTSWPLQLKRMGRFSMYVQWIKCLTWNPSWRLLYVQSCMRCCLRKNNSNNDVICAFES